MCDRIAWLAFGMNCSPNEWFGSFIDAPFSILNGFPSFPLQPFVKIALFLLCKSKFGLLVGVILGLVKCSRFGADWDCSISDDVGDAEFGDIDGWRSVRASDKSGFGLFLFGSVWSRLPPLANSSRSFEFRHFIRRFWNQIFTWKRTERKINLRCFSFGLNNLFMKIFLICHLNQKIFFLYENDDR